jgi:hypothetical protein
VASLFSGRVAHKLALASQPLASGFARFKLLNNSPHPALPGAAFYCHLETSPPGA